MMRQKKCAMIQRMCVKYLYQDLLTSDLCSDWQTVTMQNVFKCLSSLIGESEWSVCVCLYLSHDSDGRLSFGLSDSVLDQVIHVLIIQQSDQMKRAETGGTAQGQISDHHRAAEKHTKSHLRFIRQPTRAAFRSSSPVEAPLEQEEFRRFGEGRAAGVGLQDLRDDRVQPRGPLLQRVLLLQGHFEVLLQPLDHTIVTAAHPRRLLLNTRVPKRSYTSAIGC